MKTKRKIILLSFLVVLVTFVLWVIHGNTAVKVTEYSVSSEEIPASFDGYRITQVSDLHDALFGKDNERLLKKVADTKPDIIVLTGDMIDCTRPDENLSISFIEKVTEIAPTYYVTGNHESQLINSENFLEQVKNAGAVYLTNESITLIKNGEYVNLIGMDDPFFLTWFVDGNEQISVHKTLDKIIPDEGYNILLSHRPDYFDIFLINGADLVLSGHTHGGQFRLPLVGGLYTPDQGIFPMFDKGLYSSADMTMIISSGVGNSGFPVRSNNSPEIVVVTLKSAAA